MFLFLGCKATNEKIILNKKLFSFSFLYCEQRKENFLLHLQACNFNYKLYAFTPKRKETTHCFQQPSVVVTGGQARTLSLANERSRHITLKVRP